MPLAALLCAGCHTTNPPGQGIPAFEIQEAKCDEQVGAADANGPSSWTYICHATLLTRDPRYQTGELFVWYEGVSKDKNGKQIQPDRSPDVALMSDGVATITGGAIYYRKSQFEPSGVESDPGAPQLEWKILRFAPLQPVQAETQK